MHRTIRTLSAILLFATAVGAAAGESVSLRQLVGDAEYTAMGLDKLSAEEQARLARWLQLRTVGRPVPIAQPTVAFGVGTATVTATLGAAAPPAAPAAAVALPPASGPTPPARVEIGTVAAFGLRQDEVDGEVTEIRARVVGEFTGWTGKTRFKLDNGQVWQQGMSGTYTFKATDPEVIIEKTFLGYRLRLVETRRSISVRRLK